MEFYTKDLEKMHKLMLQIPLQQKTENCKDIFLVTQYIRDKISSFETICT